MLALLSGQKKKKSSEEAGLEAGGLKVEVGDQVLVAGQKHGTVRFFGKTDFAPGGNTAARLWTSRTPWTQVFLSAPSGFWFGVELDQPTGKHDGSVFGVRYFSCLPKYGVFAPPSRVQRCVVGVPPGGAGSRAVTFDLALADSAALKEAPRGSRRR